MKTFEKSIVAGVLASALCACQSVGNGQAFAPDRPGSASLLQIGTTSKAQAEQAYGQASVHRFANGYEAWTYQKTAGVPKFVNYVPYVNLFTPRLEGRTSELALLFDPAGILRQVERHEP